MSKSTEWILRIVLCVVAAYFIWIGVERTVVAQISGIFALRGCQAELQQAKSIHTEKGGK